MPGLWPDGQRRVELFHKNYDGGDSTHARCFKRRAAALVGLFDNTTITIRRPAGVKDGGVAWKLNADVVDNATLENVAGGIRVKDGGLGESK